MLKLAGDYCARQKKSVALPRAQASIYFQKFLPGLGALGGLGGPRDRAVARARAAKWLFGTILALQNPALARAGAAKCLFGAFLSVQKRAAARAGASNWLCGAFLSLQNQAVARARASK